MAMMMTMMVPMFAENMQPLMVEYLQYMGGIDIRKERLEEIDGEYHDILDKQALRKQVNMPLDKESQEFLSLYEEQRAKALSTKLIREICGLQG